MLLALVLLAQAAALSPRRLRIAYYGAPNQNLTADLTTVLQLAERRDAWIPYLQGLREPFLLSLLQRDEAGVQPTRLIHTHTSNGSE